MSTQVATPAMPQVSDPQVDAYVDALLAVAAPAPAAEPAKPAAPEAVITDAAAPESVADVVPEAEPVAEVPAGEPRIEVAVDGTDSVVESGIEAVEDMAGVADAGNVEPVAEAEPASGDDAWPETELPATVEPDAVAPPPLPAFEPIPAPAAAARPLSPAPFGVEPVQPPAAAAPVGQRWLRVAVGDDRYAVELLRVQEVVRLAPVIAVRGAAPSLLGVMNLRGRVVPVHDLGRWLRRAPVQADERTRIVVLEHQDELVGLLVTAVTDVVTLDATQIEPPTPGLRDRIGMGIARTPGAPPTVLLDARVVFD